MIKRGVKRDIKMMLDGGGGGRALLPLPSPSSSLRVFFHRNFFFAIIFFGSVESLKLFYADSRGLYSSFVLNFNPILHFSSNDQSFLRVYKTVKTASWATYDVFFNVLCCLRFHSSK